MSKEYNEYLRKHKDGVMKAFLWLCTHLPEYSSTNYYPAISMHDQSKYSVEEYDAYDEYFYGDKNDPIVKANFDMAWLHHIHSNPHHWQYWVLIEDDPTTGKNMKALPMDVPYIIEMICDWWSFSFNKGDLNEIFKWYDEHKDIMVLHPSTKELVEIILTDIKCKLKELETLE